MSTNGKLPPSWAMSTLGEICSKPQYGWTTPASHETGAVKLLRTTDITGGDVDWNTVPFCAEEPSELKKYQLASDDIVISRAGSVGASYRLRVVPEKAVFASYLIRFRSISPVNPSYVARFLQSSSYWASITDRSAGIAIPNVNAKKLETIELPIASASEQARIVEKIDELFSDLDASVAALERARANLKRYRAAVLKAAVEGRLTEQWRKAHPDVEAASKLLERILAERRRKWEEAQLAKFSAAGKTPPKGWKNKYPEPAKPDTSNLPDLPEGWCWASIEQLVVGDDPYALAIGPFGSNLKVGDYRDEGVPLVFVRNIRARAFGLEGTRYISIKKAEELRAHSIAAADLLVTKMGDPPGDACIYPMDQPPAIITADCIKVRLSEFLTQKVYFEFVINSDVAKKQIAMITKGVAQQKVSLERFRPIAVSLPPLSEQSVITHEVEERFTVIDATERELAVNLLRASRLRQSILKRAFEGKLVPQDPSDEPASVLLERIRNARAAEGTQRAHKRRKAPA